MLSIPEEVRLNATHYLTMKIQNIAINHSTDIDNKDFVMTYRKWTTEPYSFLTIDITLPAEKPFRFSVLD